MLLYLLQKINEGHAVSSRHYLQSLFIQIGIVSSVHAYDYYPISE